MDLLDNPFNVLSASPRDNRRRIMELAEEYSLLRDPDKCAEARSELTNPRKRLSAETAWLLGVGPKRTAEMLSLLETSPGNLLTVDNLPSIARANLLVAGLVRLPKYDSNNLAMWILEIADAFEKVEPKKLCTLINEERIVSGFPEVSDVSAVEAEIQERRRYYRKTIDSALDKLPSKELVKTVTATIEGATDKGECQAPILVDDIIDSYEAKAQEFFDIENENIRTIIDNLRKAADNKQPDYVLTSMVEQLTSVVKNWDVVAQPIQVSAMSRGLDHEASIRIAKLVRNLALDLFNKHNKHNLTIRLTEMLQEVFAEVGKVMEYVDKDIDQLDKIAEERAWSEPAVKLLDEVHNNIEKWPSLAYDEALKVLNTVPELIAKMEAAESNTSIIQTYKDSVAMLLMTCAITYWNTTKEWKICITLLNEALNKYAVSPDVISQIQTILEIAENNFKYPSNQTSKHIVIKIIKFILVLILCLPIASLAGVIAIQKNLEKRRKNYPSNQIFKRFVNRLIQFIVVMIACLAAGLIICSIIKFFKK